MRRYIVVKNTKQRLHQTVTAPLLLSAGELKEAQRWIREWNRSATDDRLVNYTSLPLFSADGNYVLIVRGQHIPGQGWDSIYIYKKTDGKWELATSITLSTI